MLKAGVHPKVVSERLGHSKISITLDLYSHLIPTIQQQAAESLDALFAPKVQGEKRRPKRIEGQRS